MAGDLRRGWRSFLAFDLLCKLVSVAVFAPLSAWFLRAVLLWSGDQAVSNYDLVSFFFSIQGLLLVVVWATGGFAVLFFELGGLVLLAIGIQRDRPLSATRALKVRVDADRIPVVAVQLFCVRFLKARHRFRGEQHADFLDPDRKPRLGHESS